MARAVLALSAALIVGCDGPPLPAPEAGLAPRATLEPIHTIGDDETADPMYLFGWLRSATLAPDGAVVVADGQAQQVRLYDREGRFSHLLAREGEGPGEVQRVSAVRYLGGDTVAIYDIRWPRLTLVSLEGEVHASLEVNYVRGRQLADGFVGRSSGGWWVFTGSTFGPNGSRDTAHHYRWRDTATPLEPVLELPSTHRFLRAGDDRMGGGRPHPLAATVQRALVDDSLFATDGVDSVVVVPLDGSVGRSFALPSRGEVEVDEALDAIERYRTSEGEPTNYDEVPLLDRVPRVDALMSDDQGRLWFQWYEAEHDSSWGSGRVGGEWVVTSLDGEPLFEVAFPEGLHPLEVRGDRLLGRFVSPLGVESVAVYRLRLPPPP
ncbi:hypothetical protein WI372_07815 [Gemmatimonadota bacterium DH-20]|uniref:6-bladed beta-propeller n=1 Tax=Gaopeijia maritima TaxID=3119007 RepID=A0ABU9E839_9BACT